MKRWPKRIPTAAEEDVVVVDRITHVCCGRKS